MGFTSNRAASFCTYPAMLVQFLPSTKAQCSVRTQTGQAEPLDDVFSTPFWQLRTE